MHKRLFIVAREENRNVRAIVTRILAFRVIHPEAA